VTGAEVAVVAVAAAAGAFVQGSAGFGFALVSAPLVAMVAPETLPVALLVSGLAMSTMVIARDHTGIHLAGAGWALAGSLPGSVVGAAIVAAVPESSLDVVVAGTVLTLVVLSVASPDVRPTAGVLVGAGVLSGITGTASSVGGPPVALALQHTSGKRLRATLAGYFLPSGLMSLGALAAVGELERSDAVMGVMLIAPIAAGFALSSHGARRLDEGRTRPVVLAISAASALMLVVRQLI
jgi:uncharacterized membrane protein YfcA